MGNTIGIPYSSKVYVTLLHFYERPTLVSVFANRKKSEEDFRFYEKGEKWKQWSEFVLQQFHRGSVSPKQREGSCPTPSLGSLRPPSLWTVSVSERLCFFCLFCASVSKVCLGVIATPPFQLMKVFIGIFWRVGDTCIPIWYLTDTETQRG